MNAIQNTGRRWVFAGAVFGFVAVLAGAFGAHGLKGSGKEASGFLFEKYGTETKIVAGHTVPAAYKYLGDFETGARYQMYSAMALILLGLFADRYPSKLTSVAGWCLVGGTILFSGSLYVLVIGGSRWLGIPWGLVTPIGGTLQLAGWLSFAVAAFRRVPATD